MIWKMPRTSKTCPSLTRDFRRPARKPIRSAWCAQRATCREWIRKRGIPVRKSRRQIVNRIVEAAGMGLGDFMTNRIPPRREAFSTAAHLIHKAADAAGVKLSGSAYRLNVEHKDPLEQLEITMNAQGSYPGLLKFSHALETANDFLLVREFNFAPGEKGDLA